MLYTIEADTAQGTVTLDSIHDVPEWTVFAVWEDIVVDAHNGFMCDLGRRGWFAFRTGDVVRLVRYPVTDGVMGDGTTLYRETISADSIKRPTA